MRQVGRDVDRETVQRHPALHPHPDRADFGFVATRAGPDADPPAFAPCLDAQMPERVDHPAFEAMDEQANVAATLLQVEHEITDPLSRPMIGVAPAASRLDHVEALGIEQFGRIGAGAGGEDRRMFDHPGEFGRGPGTDRGGARLHFGEAFRIRGETGADPPFDIVDHGPRHGPRAGPPQVRCHRLMACA